MTRWSWGSRTRSSPSAANWATFTTFQVDGILNSDKNVAALEAYKKLYSFTPPGWSKTFFVENNQAITENLAAMSMNYFAFFPALGEPGDEPERGKHGFFANPKGPTAQTHAAWAGRGSRSCPTRRTRKRLQVP
jgi:multiple sugar transport system substrate-binding protein